MAKTIGSQQIPSHPRLLQGEQEGQDPGSGRCPGEKRHHGHCQPCTTIKSKHNKRRRAVRKVVAKGGVGIPEVKAALAFIKLMGSIKAAKKALEVAQEIRAIV